MNTENLTAHLASADDVQTRVALQMTALMTEQAEKLPHDVRERLRFAREKAVQRARAVAVAAQQSLSPAASVSGNGGSGTLTLHPGSLGGGFGGDLWTRLGSFLPLAALVLGLLFIQHFHQRSQISAAAEVDAALLGDDVPVAAYSDPGFVEYLKSDGR
jgi:Protein of unknown function (DUF3619)